MTNGQIRVEGLDQVAANVSRVINGFPREQVSIHSHLGESVLDRARSRARVRTGRMRSSLRLRSTQQRVEIDAGQGIDYGGYQHWGTRYVSPNLFLTEPLKELENVLVRDYQRMTDRFVDRVWRSSG